MGNNNQDGSLILGIDFIASANLINSQLKTLEKEIKPLDITMNIGNDELNRIKQQLTNSSNGLGKVGTEIGSNIGKNIGSSVNEGFKMNYDKNSSKITDQLMNSLGLKGSNLSSEIKTNVGNLLRSVNEELNKSLSGGKSDLSNGSISNFSNILKNSLVNAQKELQTGKNNVQIQLDALKNTYSGFLDYFKSHPINMTNEYSKELKSLDQYSEAMKLRISDMRLFYKNSGSELNGRWGEAVNASNGLLNIDTSSDKEQIQEVIRILQDYKIKRQQILSSDKISAIDITGISNESQQWVDSIINSTQSAWNSKKAKLDNLGVDTGKILSSNITNNFAKTFSQTPDIVNQIKESFNGLGNINMAWTKDAEENVNSVTATIKNAEGIIEKFKYILNSKDDTFDLISISGADSGVPKVTQILSDYERKIAQFKSSNQSILGGLSTELQNVENSFEALKNNTGSIDALNTSFNTLKATASNITANLQSTTSSFNKLDQASNNLAKMPSTIKSLEISFDKLKTQPSEVSTNLQELYAQLEKVKVAEATGGRDLKWSEEYKILATNVQKVREQIDLLGKNEKQVQNSLTLSNTIKDLQSNLNLMKRDAGKLFTSLSPQSKDLRQRFYDLQKAIQSCDNAMDARNLSKNLSTLKKDVKEAGLYTKTFTETMKDDFKKFTEFYLAGGVFVKIANELKQMCVEVVNIDTAMTNLRKVTNEADSTYKVFLDNSIDKAKQLGTTISDIVDLSANFARLGYNIKDASKLAEVATLYQKVGDGLSTDTASSNIISVMKAFNIEASNSIGIVDRLNQVGNMFAIDSAGLGEALRLSSSALHESNTTLSESIGLIVGANDVMQDPSAVGKQNIA